MALKNFKNFKLPETEIATLKEFEKLTEGDLKFEVRDNHIVSLNLYNKGLTEVLDSLMNLEKIETLVLSNNQLTEIPEFLKNLFNLQQLEIDRNFIRELPEWVLKRIKYAFFPSQGGIINFDGDILYIIAEHKLDSSKELRIRLHVSINEKLPTELIESLKCDTFNELVKLIEALIEVLNPKEFFNIINKSDEKRFKALVKAPGKSNQIKLIETILQYLDNTRIVLSQKPRIERILSKVGKIYLDYLIENITDESSYLRLSALEAISQIAKEKNSDILKELKRRTFKFHFPKYRIHKYFFRILNILSLFFDPSDLISYLSDNHKEELNTILKEEIRLDRKKIYHVIELIIYTILDYVDDLKWDEGVQNRKELSTTIMTFKPIITDPLIHKLISGGGVNRSVMKVAEFIGEEAISLLKIVLKSEIRYVDIYDDEYHYNFNNLIDLMENYGTPKTLIKYLNSNKYFEEIFYPNWKEETYPLLRIIDFVIEGLNTSNSELNNETNKFLLNIMELLQHLITRMRSDSYASYVLYFLYSVLKKNNHQVISSFIEKLTEIEKDEFKNALKELLDKTKGIISLQHEEEIGQKIIKIISTSQERDKKNIKNKLTSGYLPDIEYLIKNYYIELEEIKSFLENLERIGGISDFFGDSEELKTNPPRFLRDSLKVIIEKTDEEGLKELFENFLPYTPPERILIPHSWESFIIENNFLNELSSEELTSLLENPDLNFFQNMVKLVLSYYEEEHVDFYWIQEGIFDLIMKKSPEAVKNSIRKIFQTKNLDDIYQLFKSEFFYHYAELIPLNMECVELALLSLDNRTVYYYNDENALDILIDKVGNRSPELLLELFRRAIKTKNFNMLIDLMASNVLKHLNLEDLISDFKNNKLNIFDLISDQVKRLRVSISNKNRTDSIDYELEFSKLRHISYYLEKMCENDEKFKDFIVKNLQMTFESDNFRSIAIAIEQGFHRFIEELSLTRKQANEIFRKLLKFFEFIDEIHFIDNEFFSYIEKVLADTLRSLMNKHEDYRNTLTRSILDSILEHTPKSIIRFLNFSLDHKLENATLLDFVEDSEFEQFFKEYETSMFQAKIIELIAYYIEDPYILEMVDRFIEIIAHIILKIQHVSEEYSISFLDGIIELMSNEFKEKFKDLLLIAIRYGYSWEEMYTMKEFVIEIFERVNRDAPIQAQYITYGDDKFIFYDGVLEFECKQEITLDISKLKNLKKLKIKNMDKKVKRIEGLTIHQSLEELDLESIGIDKIYGLEKLYNLKILKLGRNKISKISGLKDLKMLENLNLEFNKLINIEGLENLKNLKVLNLSGNQISEIEFLGQLKNLENLNLERNEIKSIYGFENLTNLKVLNLNGNQIQEISGLEKLKSLKKLELSYNEISKIKGLENLANLKTLSLRGNKITEYTSYQDAQFYVELCKKPPVKK